MPESKKEFANRSGEYRWQPSGYRAFFPATLPPDPPIKFTKELQTLLADANLALGRLDGSIQTLPQPDLFVFMYVRREAVLSSQIEGTRSSLQDLLAAEAGIFSLNIANDVDEVINYVEAMNHGLSKLAEIPVSTRLIREIHTKLLQGASGSHLAPGELRRRQNWIGPAGCTIHEAIFVPPPPRQVAEEMSKLERFIHAETELPLLIKIGLAHAQFETIHPFLDGNGRVGRLLITFLLCERKVLQKPVLYLSWFIKQNRQKYYDELQSVRDNGTWERWLAFFLRGVEVVSGQAAYTARKILALREEHRRAINENFGHATANGHRVLEHFYERPIMSVSDVQRLTETTFAAANNLVARMREYGILQEITGQSRNRKFIYRDYIGLFHDA